MRCDPTNYVFSSTGCRSGGKVTTTIGTNATAWRDIVQPDGKIVVIGAASTGGIVARYNADGTPDTSFGTGGIFTSSSPWFIDGAIQSDGKIIAVKLKKVPLP